MSVVDQPSALVEMGLTVAVATVLGPVECARRAEELPDRALLQVVVKSAPFAPAVDRRNFNPNTDRRLIEASHAVQKALEATLLLHLYPKSRIQVFVSILSDDGSKLCAAINAATLALVDAGIPMKDLCCACSAGLSDGLQPCVDLNRTEENGGDVQLVCARLPQRATIVLTQCEARLPTFDAAEQVLDAAAKGCNAVFAIFQVAIREHAAKQLAARHGLATITESFPTT